MTRRSAMRGGVGRPGKQSQGKARVSGKYVQPAWTGPPRCGFQDIAAARRLLERASDSDAAEAWFALAETYEPQMLARWGGLGVKPDLEKARSLYQRAEARGAQGARERLLALRQ